MLGGAGVNYHPYGNKGADLIETIKLERMGGANYGAGLSGAKAHPSVDTVQRVAVRRPRESRAKPWSEAVWNRPRPNSAGQMRVHSADHLQSVLSSSQEGEGGDVSSAHPLSPVSARLQASPTAMSASQVTCASYTTIPASPSRGGRRPRPKSAAPALPAREMLRQQNQIQHERILRRMRQQMDAKAKRAEREFQQAREKLEREQAFYVPQASPPWIAALSRCCPCRSPR